MVTRPEIMIKEIVIGKVAEVVAAVLIVSQVFFKIEIEITTGLSEINNMAVTRLCLAAG